MSCFSESWKAYDFLRKDVEIIERYFNELSLPIEGAEQSIGADKYFRIPLPTLINKHYHVAKQFAIERNALDGSTAVFSMKQIDDLSLFTAALGDKLYYYKSQLLYPEIRKYLVINHKMYNLAEQIKQLLIKYGTSPSVFYAAPIVEARNAVTDFRKKQQIQIDEIYNGCLNRGEVTEKFKSEYKLFTLVKSKFSEAVFQYSPDWLSPMRIDIYIPSINIAIEYQGVQHYQAVDYFGGEEGLEQYRKRDKKKLLACLQHGVKVYYWKYCVPFTMENLLILLEK